MKILYLMKELGYPVDNKGMCYGIAMTAIQAIIRSAIYEFKERLNFINSYDHKIISYKIESNTVIYCDYRHGNIIFEIPQDVHVPPWCPEIKEKLAILLLKKDIESAENRRRNKTMESNDKRLLKIKEWFDTACIFQGLNFESPVPNDQKVWEKNFNCWDGQNKPFTHQDYNRGINLFKSTNMEKHFYLNNLKSHSYKNEMTKARQSYFNMYGSIHLQEKLLCLLDENNISKLINCIKESNTPIAYLLCRLGHVISLGGSKLLGVHLINHDDYQNIPAIYNIPNITQIICKALFKEENLSDKNTPAISVHVFGIRNNKSLAIQEENYPYWQFMSDEKLEYDTGLLSTALTCGHAAAVNIYITKILKTNLKNDHKVMLLAAKDNNGIPGLCTALQKDSAETVWIYMTTIINSNNLLYSDKLTLLAAKSKNGNPGLCIALNYGNAAAVEKYTTIIINSNKLLYNDKLMLLAAKISNGNPGLRLSLLEGHAAAVEKYTTTIINSNKLLYNDKLTLLAAKNKNGNPGLCIALQRDSSEALEKYMTIIINSSNLSYNDKLTLLAAKRNDGTPGLYLSVEEGHAKVVEKYMTIIINSSNLSYNDKLTLLSAKNNDRIPGLCIALQEDRAEAVWIYMTILQNTNKLSDNDKVTLLAAKNKNVVTGLFYALQEGSSKAVGVYLSVIKNIDYDKFAKDIMQTFPGDIKDFKNELLDWAQFYELNKQKSIADYPLLVAILSYQRGMFFSSWNETASMKALKKFTHWV